jgi:CxxC-x17-CxxC domain-containing protein
MSQRTERISTEIKCTECGKTATVPFKPTPGKPVYCKECLPKHVSKRSDSPRSEGASNRTSDSGSEKQAWSRRRTDWK